MIVVDAHQDIAYNAVCFGRDYLKSAIKKRLLEAGTGVPSQNGKATIGWPESVAGRVAIVFATIFTAPRSRKPQPWSQVMYSDVAEAHQLGIQQLDYYHKMADSTDKVRLVLSKSDLDDVLATWEPEKSLADRQQGLVLLMENADPIREPQELDMWYERGVRLIGPAWQGTRYCGGTGMPGPLTDMGRDLLDQMMDLNMLLDLSHMAEAAFLEALDQYEGSVIASHSNPRRFRESDRHLSDAMIRRLSERDGVMGIVMYSGFLSNEWTQSDGKRTLTLATVVDAIDHVCQVTGSAAHVGLGSDFDGGFGAESIPAEIDTVADLLRVADVLRSRGYDEDDVTAIMGGNMLRKLRPVLD